MDLEYHRLARADPGYRWWKAIATGFIALGFFIVLTVVLVLLLVVVALLSPDIFAELRKLLETGVIDNTQPIVLVLSLASVAVMLPSIWLARLIMGPRPAGLLSSVAGRLRFAWMSRLLIPVAIAYGASTLLSLFLLPILGVEPLPAAQVTSATWLLVLIAVLLVPVQAAAEEYVFRGYLMQAIGGWLRHPAFAMLLPIPLFAIGHDYDIWGLLDVSLFALMAAWLTWRTGGLEAALVAHIVNNTLIFVIGAFGLFDVNAKSGNWQALLITAATLALYSWLVVRAAKRFGLQRVLPEPEPSPEPFPEPSPGPEVV